jgi:prevent-host-death family protein
MRSVGLKVLKNKLSEYVRRAAAGERVLIVNRDRVVAELVPPEATRSPMLSDALLADAVRQGYITPALRGPGGPPATEPIAPLGQILAELDQDREER